MPDIKVTDHAVERFKQRVSSIGSHRSDFRKKVEKWCNTSMKQAKYIGEGSYGAKLYRHCDWIIVLDANQKKVITIKPSAQSQGLSPDVEDGIKDTIRKQIIRLVRPHLVRQQEIIISIHDHQLRRIRVHNPKTKATLKTRIGELQTQLDEVRKEINAHASLAYQYGVKIDEEEI